MEIEKINAARVNLIGYCLPEFDILVVPTVQEDGETVNDCYLTKRGYATLYYMFGCCESIENAAILAYRNVPDYLSGFMQTILEG